MESSSAFSCSCSGYPPVICTNTHSKCQWPLDVSTSAWCLGEMAATETRVHGQGAGEDKVSSSRSPCMGNQKTRAVLYTTKDTHPTK